MRKAYITEWQELFFIDVVAEKSVEHARVLTEKNGSMCIRSANETNGIFHQY